MRRDILIRDMQTIPGEPTVKKVSSVTARRLNGKKSDPERKCICLPALPFAQKFTPRLWLSARPTRLRYDTQLRISIACWFRVQRIFPFDFDCKSLSLPPPSGFISAVCPKLSETACRLFFRIQKSSATEAVEDLSRDCS